VSLSIFQKAKAEADQLDAECAAAFSAVAAHSDKGRELQAHYEDVAMKCRAARFIYSRVRDTAREEVQARINAAEAGIAFCTSHGMEDTLALYRDQLAQAKAWAEKLNKALES